MTIHHMFVHQTLILPVLNFTKTHEKMFDNNNLKSNVEKIRLISSPKKNLEIQV